MASEKERPGECNAPTRPANGPAVDDNVMPREPSDAALGAADEDKAEEFEIDAEFRRKLAGLRRLRRDERPFALRAAREWRRLALKALREKRTAKRHTRYVLWRSRHPVTKQPG
jgi:hypothetical protein